MGAAIATEITTNQLPALTADLVAVGGPIAAVILTVAMSGVILSFLKRKVGR